VIDVNNGSVSEKEEYILETDGSNLETLLTHPMVEPTKTYSNDIHETCQILGIEAAVDVLFQEINQVISFDGTYVDHRHIMLVVNAMTHKGSIVAMTRHGANKTNTGFLLKSSFEKPIEILLDSAIYSKVDHLQGPTETIIMGKRSNIGTGALDVLYYDPNNTTVEQKQPNRNKRKRSPVKNEELEKLYKKQRTEQDIVSTFVFDESVDMMVDENCSNDAVHSLIQEQLKKYQNHGPSNSRSSDHVQSVHPYLLFDSCDKSEYKLPSPKLSDGTLVRDILKEINHSETQWVDWRE
jgi:hypothetical protein